MQCDRAAELIGAYLDHELDPTSRREVAAHLAGCPACSALAEELQQTSRQVAVLGRERAPAGLGAVIKERLAASASAPRGLQRLAGMAGHAGLGRWMGRAAALVIACGLTAAATALVMSRMETTSTLEREVVTAHVRSLLQESPTQIASSELHTVKPWFNGRLDFAPTVKDLAADGFPLAGARLDYVGERRVAALVYRRRLHVVNVFLWPSPQAADSAPATFVYRGYNIMTFSRGGLVYWAVSDLNMDELRLLAGLL